MQEYTFAQQAFLSLDNMKKTPVSIVHYTMRSDTKSAGVYRYVCAYMHCALSLCKTYCDNNGLQGIKCYVFPVCTLVNRNRYAQTF